MMTASDELQPGDVIGGYEIVREIGRGGMGVVYKARETALHRVVALKVLPANLARDPNFIQRFYREARAVAQLEHPNIVTIYNLGQSGDTHYIAMQFVRGEALSDIIKREGPLDPRRALEIARQTADALGMAHRRGIIHRDVKPHNVMIDEDGRAKVMDFGIAKIVEEQGGLTRTGDMIGTPAYMSPEQCRGQNVDGRSDIYSLGVVLYQSLTGVTPFRAETPIAMIQKILFEPYDPIPVVQQKRLPKSIDTILAKSLGKDPTSRYDNAETMAEDLRRAMENLPVTGGVTIPAMPAPSAPQLIVTPPPGPAPAEALVPAGRSGPPPTPATAIAPQMQYAPPPQPQYAAPPPQYPPPQYSPPPPYPPTAPMPPERGGSLFGTLAKGIVLGFALIGLIAAAGVWLLREKPEDTTVTVEKIASYPRQSAREAGSDAPETESRPRTPERETEQPVSARPRPERRTEPPADDEPPQTPSSPTRRETTATAPEPPPAQPGSTNSALSSVIASLSRRRDMAQDAKAQRVLLDAVEKKDPLAQMAYAIAQHEGALGFSRQEQRAKTLAATTMPEVEKLADSGDAEAQYLLGRAAQVGLGSKRDATRAAEFYQAAATQGHVPSINALARLYDSEEAPGPNPAQATFWRQRAARKGDPEAMHNLAIALRRGEGVDKDPGAAIDLLHKSAESGLVESMRDLGLAYQTGDGVPRDQSEAIRWYDQAAKAGDSGSMNNLATIMLNDADASQSDRASAINLLRRAADAGSVEAMTNLGSAYEQGLGVRADPAEAAGWYKHAAEAGDPVAMHNLALCYDEGYGLRADPAEAMAWRRKAAEANQPDAMNDMGWAYETGTGVKRDVDEAIVWYRKAARAGSKTALENLARLDVTP